ncbi:NmrA/HSCARG family protein [Ralstonia sp. A12]|uniref:NmrA/HSCARG family protein n=1 Tax=Ralstonia sp. A12 TaxID=1217052 RepID=UPI001E2A2AFB|nr:NmrA/HSCARG family protein [Ralstonia sp. A12]
MHASLSQNKERVMSRSVQTVLVVGAAGKFAGLVVPELVARGVRVRGLVRDERGAAQARQRGASEIAIGDLRDVASQERAAAGVDGVFYIGPAFAAEETQMGLNMIDVAQRAGVRRFVFSSVIQPTDTSLENHVVKVPVESALYASGMAYTILHPANFFQNLERGWDGIVAQGRLAEPLPASTRVARVDYRDVAEVAAIALTSDRLAYGTFELCSDEAPTRGEIARLISDALGREIEAAEMSFEQWAARAARVLDPHQLAMLGNVQKHYARHGLRGNSLTLRAILGRPPRTLAQYIGELAAATRMPSVA